MTDAKYVDINEIPETLEGKRGKWKRMFASIPDGKALVLENVTLNRIQQVRQNVKIYCKKRQFKGLTYRQHSKGNGRFDIYLFRSKEKEGSATPTDKEPQQ